jgi:hypothetical protein
MAGAKGFRRWQNRTGAPRSLQRTWDDNVFFRLLSLEAAKAVVGLPPDFLRGAVESRNFMRLSLEKAAHANMDGAAYRKSGSPVFFVPRTPDFLSRLVALSSRTRGPV